MNYWAPLRLHIWRSFMQLTTHKVYMYVLTSRCTFTTSRSTQREILVAYLIHCFSGLKCIFEQDNTVWSVSLYLSAELISEGTKVWGDIWRKAKAENISTGIFVRWPNYLMISLVSTPHLRKHHSFFSN